MPFLLALLFAPAMRRVTTRKLAVGSTGSEWNDHMRVEGDSPARQSDVCPTQMFSTFLICASPCILIVMSEALKNIDHQ